MPIDIIGQDRNRGIGKVQMSFLMSARGGGGRVGARAKARYFDGAAVKCAKIDRAINDGGTGLGCLGSKLLWCSLSEARAGSARGLSV